MTLGTSSVMMNKGTLSIFLAIMCQFAAADYVEKFGQILKPFLEDCKKYVGASDADVEKVSTMQLLTTQTQSCLQYCAFSEFGMMNGTTIDDDYALEMFKTAHKGDVYFAKGPEIVNGCLAEAKKLKTDDSCLLAYFFHQCIHDQSFSLVYDARS
ncbi:general odorant-binding protein 19d [Anabrus simplex]|uniref:general odorant-binding protein 19d n=1 Tax=Anabrus simplex TaxID=316456 RepID=UPI0035A39CC3